MIDMAMATFALLVMCVATTAQGSTIMNKDAPHSMYKIANPPDGKSPYIPNSISHRGEYIEVYSGNISTVYSEVFWAMMPPVPLPADFVARFKGKTVSFTGYEADAVRQMPDGSEQHVPLYDQYNHHHNAFIQGENTRLVDVGPAGSDIAPSHGGIKGRWEPRDVPLPSAKKASSASLPDDEVPTAQYIVDGNGGEYRMSLHSVPKGSGQLVHSPTQFQIQPMMINSNGGGGGSNSEKGPGHWDLFAAGSYGRARGATMPHNSAYSPLLECPCTDRKPKVITYHRTVESGVCPTRIIATATDCFTAASALGLTPVLKNETVHSATRPEGCFVMSTQTGYETFFNLEPSKAECGLRAGAHVRSTGFETVSSIDLKLDLDAGAGNGTQTSSGVATITMSGPDENWFGVGFDASTMSDRPYAIVVDGATGKVSEHRLSDHAAGAVIASSVTVVSNTVADGRRTVLLTRALVGKTSQHFTFKASATGLPFIAAVGNTPSLAYHKSRAGGTVMLVEVGAPLCVCPSFGSASSGSIDGVQFNVHCAAAPRSTLLNATHDNDICDIATYEGGLKCCAHKSILLDSNQTGPSGPGGPVDTYRMKFRLYFEDYAGQDNAFFMFVVNEAGAGEYDIPQALEGEEPVHTLIGNFRVRDSMKKCTSRSDVWCAPGWNESSKVALLRAGMHCHAPACINETLYNMDTEPPSVICYNEPLYGEGTFPESGQTFNEAGYAVGIPPCFWGSEEEGLRPSPVLSLDTNLRSVMHVNSTFYHYGVMAQWQMRGKWVRQ